MSTLDDWLAQVCDTLDLPPDSIPTERRDALLDVTRDVAHGVARIAGPLTCYLVGIAVGRGEDPAVVLDKLGVLTAGFDKAAE